MHGVFALHACDTATCDALALGIALRAELIAVAPCCQAELARAWSALDARGDAGAFRPIWGAPHLRRETAAHITDAMRTLLLRSAGYEVLAIEGLSVMIQVVSFKTRGKRIFLMAPLHHHFELKGWKESKIIIRFWIASLIFALFSLSTLKLR